MKIYCFVVCLGLIVFCAYGMNQQDNPYELIHAISFPYPPCYANASLRVQELINAGYDPNVPYVNRIPIRWARDLPIIKILIANKATVTLETLTDWLDPWGNINSFLIGVWGSENVDYKRLNTLLLNVDAVTLKKYISRCKAIIFEAFLPQKKYNLGNDWKEKSMVYLRILLFYDPSILKLDFSDENVDLKDPLMLQELAERNELEAVKILLWHGADITVQDKNGKIAFDKTTDPILKKLLAIEPKNLELYNKNPQEYRSLYASEFNPVNKYPQEFTMEEKCHNYLAKKLSAHQMKQIKKEHGSIINYLNRREKGGAI